MRTATVSVDGRVVANRVRVARSVVARMVGLLTTPRLEEGAGILLAPCSSVHTVFMRYPIDVVYLDRENTVVRVAANLRPFRLSVGGRGARRALELAAGTAQRAGLRRGVRLEIQEDG